MADKVGDFQIIVAGAAVPFWAFAPGTTVAAAAAPAGADAGVAPTFGMLDVVIETSGDPLVTTSVVPPAFASTVADPPVTTMPLVPDVLGQIRIAFAVPTSASPFEGILRLTARRTGGNVTMEIPISVATGALADDVFIFFVVHPDAARRYVWTQLRAVERANPATGVPAAGGSMKVLRDNSRFRELNRRFATVTDDDGLICLAGTRRNVLGLMIDWPLIAQVTKLGFVDRAHLLRLSAQPGNTNAAPFVVADPVRLTNHDDASLAAKSFMVDAGHGVVYGFAPARRSQEWYVAHKVADSVIAQLQMPPFNVPAASIFRTRTAGFAMIDPARPTASDAPESGDTRFEFDLPERRVRGVASAVTLKALSELVLTRHDHGTHAALAIDDADRATILDANAVTLAAISTRLAAAGKPVRAGTIRWDAARKDYVFTNDNTGEDHHFPIATGAAGDWFWITDTHLDVLAERAVIWSLAAEIESAPAGDPSTGLPAFGTAVRATMIADGAFDYMKAAILMYSTVAPPHEWLNHGIKGWGPNQRNDYFNVTPCDLYVTLHENAGGGIGGTALIALPTAGVDAPPDDQIKIGKFFLKYVDGFDQGLRQGGVSREIPTNPAAMLRHNNHVRDRYYYLESEFMDRVSSTSPTRYQIQDMIDGTFIANLASQIVAAIVEISLDPQPDMDAIRLTNSMPFW